MSTGVREHTLGYMGMGNTVVTALRSLLALALALGAVVAVNWIGAALGDVLGIAQGKARLAWDLFWVFCAGTAAAWVMVRLAPRAPVAHAWAFFAIALVIDAVGVAQMWDAWPLWFSLGVLLTLPLQVWLGASLALRSRGMRGQTTNGSASQ